MQLNRALDSIKDESKYTLARNEADEITRMIQEEKND